MKKYIYLLIILICLNLSLSGAEFTSIYHKNYDEIDRVVLVFDEKPEYDVVEGPSYIEIEAKNSIRSNNVKEQNFSDNKVLSSFSYSQRGTNLSVMISLNDKQRQIYGKEYKLEHFDLEKKDMFKIVLDIFINGDPQTVTAHQNYADFYNSVGYSGKAEEHLMAIKEIEERLTPPVQENESANTTTVEKKPVVKKKADSRGKGSEFFQNIGKWFQKVFSQLKTINIKYIIGFIILIIVIIAVIFFLKRKPEKQKKKKKKPAAKNNFRNQESIGDDEFQKKMVTKLFENGWETEAIAKELNLTVKEVEQLIEPLQK